jgi:hypothetical protein
MAMNTYSVSIVYIKQLSSGAQTSVSLVAQTVNATTEEEAFGKAVLNTPDDCKDHAVSLKAIIKH